MKRKPLAPHDVSLPEELRPFWDGATVSDSSCSPTAQTFFLEKGGSRWFLKTNEAGVLERENRMSQFLHGHRMAPLVLFYRTIGSRDYLVTEALPGEDGIDDRHRGNPRKLAQVFGEALRKLHDLPQTNCPYPHRSVEMVEAAEANIEKRTWDTSLIPEPFETAVNQFHRGKHLLVDEVVLHGDYCLPNILLEDFQFSGFVDLANGGIGDRHFDLFWGLWTLEFNLQTTAHNATFLEAYGKGLVDEAKLDLCRLVSGFLD